ncbi:MAG: hypothetical protein IJN50_04830 [Clostridia bacterium]|nr:hypothetical protein [Clostridia bacterium]
MQSFLESNTLDKEYIQGFYLHLITDYLFYKEYLDGYKGNLYNDYNKLNKFLIEKYSVELPTEVQDEVEFEDGTSEIIDQDSICKFIEALAGVDFLEESKLIDFINSFSIRNKNIERDEKMTDTVEMKIANAAAAHWQSDGPKTIEEAMKITDKSEIASVIGLVEKLGLNADIIQQLIGSLDEEGKPIGDGIIYTQGSIPQNIATQIKNGLEGNEKYKNILNVLSVVHDNWVRNNPNNFLKPGRNKERQFVPLELLDWGEVQNDLVFLKPILESAGIEINIEILKKEFDMIQEKYMIDNKIFSNEDMINYLMKGSESYEALKGLETNHGGEIDFLLKQKDIAVQMAEQMEKRGVIGKPNNFRQVTPGEIANSSKELTTPQVKGVKAFLENLRNKLQNLFKGKEEK